MVLLPDYPEKVVLAHRLRVERLALFCTLVLIGGGGWWLAPAVTGEVEMLPRIGPVLVLFASALLLPNLIDYGPVERSSLGAAANIAWPSILAFAGIHYGPEDAMIASLILVVIAVFLWRFTNHLLGGNLKTRKWRGLTSIAGLAIAIAILVSMSGDATLWAVVIGASLVTLAPDLLAKDDNHEARAEFATRLEQAETRILALREGGSGLEQSASLLKTAREEGWKDPSRGMGLIAQAEIELERTQAVAVDLDAIRSDALEAVKRAEEITLDSLGPRKAFEAGDREADLGSPRDAELLYRHAKQKAAVIEEHWQNAADAIAESVAAIGDHTGHQADAVRDILRTAEEALQAEEPKEALHIASSIPEHLESLGSSEEAAAKSLSDAEHAVAAAEDDIQIATKERLEQARRAMESGDPDLAKGLSDSVLREVRATSDAMQEMQRALRQRKQIEAKFPAGAKSEWEARLEQAAGMAEAGEWQDAAQAMGLLTSDLQSLEHKLSEATELVRFVDEEWKALRRKLDSSGVGPADPDRMAAEKAVSEASNALEQGDIDSCHKALGAASEMLESQSRRV
jgi:hypothetical protein